MVQYITCMESSSKMVKSSFYDLQVSLNFYGIFYDFNVFIDHHIWLSMISLFLVWWWTRDVHQYELIGASFWTKLKYFPSVNHSNHSSYFFRSQQYWKIFKRKCFNLHKLLIIFLLAKRPPKSNHTQPFLFFVESMFPQRLLYLRALQYLDLHFRKVEHLSKSKRYLKAELELMFCISFFDTWLALIVHARVVLYVFDKSVFSASSRRRAFFSQSCQCSIYLFDRSSVSEKIDGSVESLVQPLFAETWIFSICSWETFDSQRNAGRFFPEIFLR